MIFPTQGLHRPTAATSHGREDCINTRQAFRQRLSYLPLLTPLCYILLACRTAAHLEPSPVAQRDSSRSISPKDPAEATTYSLFLPGAGHIYAGESAKGIALLMAGLGGAALYLDAKHNAANTVCDASHCRTEHITPDYGYVAMGLAIASWVYGIADAGRAARRYNEDHGLAASPVIEPTGRGANVGLRVRFR